MFGESCYSLLVWPFKGQFSYHCSYPEKYFEYRPVFLTAACSEDMCERDEEGSQPFHNSRGSPAEGCALRQYNTDITRMRTFDHFILWAAITSWRVGISHKKSSNIIIGTFKNNQNLAYVKQLHQMYVFFIEQSSLRWMRWVYDRWI